MSQKKHGYQYSGIVSNGSQLLDIFKAATKKDGSILSVMTFSHSGPVGIFLDPDAGFYRGNHLLKGPEGGNVSELVSAIKRGEIKFADNASWFFGSCFTGTEYIGPGIAESITAETGITTIGATGHVVPEILNGKETGRFKSAEKGSTFFQFKKVFEVIYEVKNAKDIDWVGSVSNVTDNTVTFKFDSKAKMEAYQKSFNYDNKYKYTIKESVEKTNLGNVIDPQSL